MGNLLYLFSLIMVISWSIGFIGYGAGGPVHILLVFAILAVILRVILALKSIQIQN
jgi:hypothetical protein